MIAQEPLEKGRRHTSVNTRWMPLLIVLLAACASESVTHSEPFSLERGHAIGSPLGVVSFAQVVRDTRCRPEADCVSTGEVAIEVEIHRADSNEIVILEGLWRDGPTQGTRPFVILEEGASLWLLGLSSDDPAVATLLLNPAPRM